MDSSLDNSQDQQHGNDSQQQVDNSKVNEYIKELLKEKISFDPAQHPHAMRLLEDEVVKSQAKGKVVKETKYVDLYRDKPVRVSVKVLVPVKEHPRFNFVGKLLGPKGNSLKRLQEETMTKMAILGRGSMRDKSKEEELRNTLDPKYSHLSEELHVEIAALASPAEAHARIAYALAELRKYLVPDSNDEIRLEQLREISGEGGRPPRGGGPPVAGRGRPLPPPVRPPPIPPRMGPGVGRGKDKVLSILDRARQAMEEPAYGEFEEPPYFQPPPPAPSYGGDYNGGGSDYYEAPYSGGGGGAGRWKGFKARGGAAAAGGGRGGSRSAPYSRPSK